MFKLATVFLVLSLVLVATQARSLREEIKRMIELERRARCIPLGGTGCEANNGKCCRKGNPYTGIMRSCKNTGSFDSPVYTCVEAGRKRTLGSQIELERRACIALGQSGCEANNGKCCRKGNPYTGTMRKCKNTGSFDSPVYTCVEA